MRTPLHTHLDGEQEGHVLATGQLDSGGGVVQTLILCLFDVNVLML